jgi:uncharacterized phage-associated protein
VRNIIRVFCLGRHDFSTIRERKEQEMANAQDVAAYILEKLGCVSAMKLQKLVYYSQAWSLVWEERPLFSERIEAWVNGPVVPSLYEAHRGLFELSRIESGSSDRLSSSDKDTIDHVLEFYGDKSAQWLSDLTHAEDPWIDARKGLAPHQRGNAEISHAAMAEYYGSL